MNDMQLLDKTYHQLIDDVAAAITKNDQPQMAAKEAVQCVAKWLVSPQTDLCLPEQMQFSNHSTALLLNMGQPLDD